MAVLQCLKLRSPPCCLVLRPTLRGVAFRRLGSPCRAVLMEAAVRVVVCVVEVLDG
jgi:hypothetical protein